MVGLNDTLNVNIEKVIPFNTYNHLILKELPSIYKGNSYKSVNYLNLKLNGNIKSIRFCMFPIKQDSNIIGISVILQEKSSYIKDLEKNSISSSLQENADFGIYKYDYENKLVHLSKGASFLMFNEFIDKTISIDSFFDVVNKKDFIENYHSSNLINNPHNDKFETEASLKVLNEKNIRLKFFGIIESKNNSSFIGDYGYIFNISSYYVPEFKDKIALSTEHMSDEVFITDLSGEVLYLNRKAKRTFELDKSTASTFSIYKFHKDITNDWWYHKLIPSLSKNNSCSIILDFKNPKKYIQFKFYIIDVNNRQLIYTVGRDITEDREFQKELKLMSNYDQLTMILNRRGIYDNMSLMFTKESFAVVIIDLDNFKPVNDTFGHLAGDLVISTLAKRLESSSPSDSLVGRLSGDEFIVIIPEYGNLKDLENKIKKIHKSITRKYIISQGVCTIGASIGISLYPENGQSRNELFRKADEAMYSVKKSGKNGYLIYSNLL
jgi:diguanylate cyclase (GGDEF)-like protein